MKKGFALAELVIFVAIVALLFWPMALWTNRSLDFWATQMKHHAVHIPFWLAFVVTLVGNGVILLFDVVSEIARYFI